MKKILLGLLVFGNFSSFAVTICKTLEVPRISSLQGGNISKNADLFTDALKSCDTNRPYTIGPLVANGWGNKLERYMEDYLICCHKPEPRI